MRSKAMLFAPLALIIFASACSSANQPALPERVFTAPWSMEPSAVDGFRTRVNAINLGDKVDHVVAIVGVPDSDQTFKKNETNRIFTYYVTRQRADSPIESDKIVLIAFNGRNKVKATYSNVENIATRNWPGHSNTVFKR